MIKELRGIIKLDSKQKSCIIIEQMNSYCDKHTGRIYKINFVSYNFFSRFKAIEFVIKI